MAWFRRKRRNGLMHASLNATEWSVLERRWVILPRLPSDVREAVGGIARVLLHEKNFEGCGGLVLSDEHRLLISAQAALLLVGRDHDFYPGLRSILVYPSPFVGRARSTGPGGMVTESRGPRAGESWHHPGTGPGWGGPVILSWADVASGASGADGCRNVTLHEFAHQLDAESELMEGIPRLGTREEVDRWRGTLVAELGQLVMRLRAGLPVAIDEYGSQNPAEFFACATESYFMRPRELRSLHGPTYQLLRSYYRLDPAAWSGNAAERVDAGRRSCCG